MKKKISLNFFLEENNLIINKKLRFTNNLFEHLLFEESIVADLQFLAGITKNILIPKYNLRWTIAEDY